MTEEKSILNIAEIIFSNPVGNKKSINLEFENYKLKDVHKDLLTFFTYGMKYKYSNDNGVVDLKKINIEQIKEINSYMNMIGIDIHFKTYNEYDYDKMYNENFKYQNNDKLEDYRFKLKSEDTIYVIYFSLI